MVNKTCYLCGQELEPDENGVCENCEEDLDAEAVTI